MQEMFKSIRLNTNAFRMYLEVSHIRNLTYCSVKCKMRYVNNYHKQQGFFASFFVETKFNLGQLHPRQNSSLVLRLMLNTPANQVLQFVPTKLLQHQHQDDPHC